MGPTLLLALEFSERVWKLGFTTGPGPLFADAISRDVIPDHLPAVTGCARTAPVRRLVLNAIGYEVSRS